jgi:protein-L-isoaspartate(D-aspartate) O-methyltransferase
MDYAVARHNMVENQIRTNRVRDPLVLEAMAQVPRELFVPKQMRGIAYVDEDIDLGNGRYLIEPLVLARLLQLADVRSDDVALVIGCGTGYTAAVLARLASTVVALEGDADLATRASGLLAEQGADNVAVVTGPLRDGYPTQAPYDVIIVDGGVQEIPTALCNQLADGGRLVAVTMDAAPGNMGHGTLVSRIGGSFSRRVDFDAATPILPGFTKTPSFVF